MANTESLEKLNKILSKRIGRNLTDQELETTYKTLMEFATCIYELEKDSKN